MIRQLKLIITMLLVLAMTTPHSVSFVEAAELPAEAPVVIRTWCISDVATGTDEQVMTVSGSAIRLGGNSSLSDGIVLITPEDGDTLQSVQTETGDLNFVTVSIFKEDPASVYQRLPEDIRSTIDSNEDGYIIYISKSYYMNKHGEFDIAINISDNSGELIKYIVNVKPSSMSYGVDNLEPGSIYNPFHSVDTLKDAVSSLPANSTNWYMASRGASMENTVFAISDGMDGKEFGEMLIKDYGSRSLYIKSNVDGREWEIFFNIRLGADQPLTEVSVNANGEEFSWQPYNPSVHNNIPNYILRPQAGSELVVYNDVVLTLITTPDSEIRWSESKYNGQYLIENEELSFDDTFYFEGNSLSNPIEIWTNTEERTIHVKADGNLESDILDLVITKDEKTYNYQILFMRNQNISFSMKYMEAFCVPYNQPIDLFEYFFWSRSLPAEKDYILERINSGQYIVNIAGAQLLYEEGVFKGNVKFTRPGASAYIYDTQNKLIVSSGSLSIYMRNNYILSANDTLDLGASLNMSLSSDNHLVEVTGNSEAYQQNNFVIKANEIVESDSIIVRVKNKYDNNLLGIITIKIVGTNDDMETVIGDTVDEISEGAVLNININTVSKSIFNRLTNKNGYVSLLNKNVIWTFDGQNISVDKAKDVDLEVKVGAVLDETAKTEILKIIEQADADSILMDFPENGELPGPASMKIALTAEQVDSLKNRNEIYLYYFNKSTNQLEQEDADILVEQDYSGNYYVQFTVNHNSDFVLSTDQTIGSVVTSPEDPDDTVEPTDPTPEEPTDPIPSEPEEPEDPIPSEPTEPEVPSNPAPVIPSNPAPSETVVIPSPIPNQEKAEDTMVLKTAAGTMNVPVTAVESKEGIDVSIELPMNILENIGNTVEEEVVIPVATPEILKFISKSEAVNVNIEITAPRELTSGGNWANINLNTELLEILKAEKKSLTVSVKDDKGKSLYEWNITGSDLAEMNKKINDINLSLNTKYVNDRNEIKKLTNQKNQGIIIDFNHNGVLPVQAKVKVYVGDIVGKGSDSDIEMNRKVYLYHYNTFTGKLETIPYSSNYKVNKDGYLELRLIHCSEYVILPKEADSRSYTSLRNQISIDVKNKSLEPKKTVNVEVKLPNTLELVDNKKDKSTQSVLGFVTVAYTSDNAEVASVDKKGKITAKKAGTTTITTKITLYSGKTKTVKTKIIVK